MFPDPQISVGSFIPKKGHVLQNSSPYDVARDGSPSDLVSRDGTDRDRGRLCFELVGHFGPHLVTDKTGQSMFR